MDLDAREHWIMFMVRIAILPEPPGPGVADLERVEAEVRELATQEGARVAGMFWPEAFTALGDMKSVIRAVALVETRSQYPVSFPDRTSLERYVHPPPPDGEIESLGPEDMLACVLSALRATGRYVIADIERWSRRQDFSTTRPAEPGPLGEETKFWAYVAGWAAEEE